MEILICYFENHQYQRNHCSSIYRLCNWIALRRALWRYFDFSNNKQAQWFGIAFVYQGGNQRTNYVDVCKNAFWLTTLNTFSVSTNNTASVLSFVRIEWTNTSPPALFSAYLQGSNASNYVTAGCCNNNLASNPPQYFTNTNRAISQNKE